KKTPWSALILIFSCLPLAAHHSLDAEYDRDQPVTISGTVTEIAWTNPHSYIYLEATHEDGQVVRWRFEGYPPRFLAGQGWTKDETLQPGDSVTIQGWKALDGSPAAHGTIVILENGRRMLFGAQGPQQTQGP